MRDGRIKLAAMVASASLVAYGVLALHAIFATVGAILFVLGSVLDLVEVRDASQGQRARPLILIKTIKP